MFVEIETGKGADVSLSRKLKHLPDGLLLDLKWSFLMCLWEVNGLCPVFWFHCGLCRETQCDLKIIAGSSGAPKVPNVPGERVQRCYSRAWWRLWEWAQ
jgi:hypothetical protein